MSFELLEGLNPGLETMRWSSASTCCNLLMIAWSLADPMSLHLITRASLAPPSSL
ncbi:MAG: hypothetical protein LBM94_04720 [Propionibacteriaceae bacterium]|nr:hypothetical protein [Propionibacteriaceae bacterium]